MQHIAGFFRRIRPVIGISDDGKPEMTFSFSAGTVGVAELREAFELPEKLRKSGVPLVIVFRALPESQRLVARSLAREPVAAFTDDYRTRHFLPGSSTVGTAVRRLVADSRIDMVDGKYRHLDPVFAHHLRASC